MNDSKKAENTRRDEPGRLYWRCGAGVAGPAGQASAESQIPSLSWKTSGAKTRVEDKVLRTLAEMENLRRRAEREAADAKTYGVTHSPRYADLRR